MVKHVCSFCVSSSLFVKWRAYTASTKLSCSTLEARAVECGCPHISRILPSVAYRLISDYCSIGSLVGHQAESSLRACLGRLVSLAWGLLIYLVLHSLLKAHSCFTHCYLLAFNSVLLNLRMLTAQLDHRMLSSAWSHHSNSIVSWMT